MGRAHVVPEGAEARLAEHLLKTFEAMGLRAARQDVGRGRANAIGRLDGDVPPEHGGTLVLLEAHIDTVPVDGMTIDPFAAEVRDGRLYGRGACDVKGGLTAMLGATERLASSRPEGCPTVVLAGCVNEEYGFTGARALCDLFGESTSIVGGRPDLAIVADPTGLDVVVAHKGLVRWRCRTRGLSVHSSAPETGHNAIYDMARVVTAFQRYQAEVLDAVGPSPDLGGPTVSVGTVAGGAGVNLVPDRCVIEIDRRLLPGEDPEAAWRDARDWVDAASGVPAIHERPFLAASPLGRATNASIADQLLRAVRERRPAAAARVVPYATDAALFSAAGVPSVVFGPGSIEQAHTADEWLPLAELDQARDALARFLAPAATR